jgi:hypothetical protein
MVWRYNKFFAFASVPTGENTMTMKRKVGNEDRVEQALARRSSKDAPIHDERLSKDAFSATMCKIPTTSGLKDGDKILGMIKEAGR